ncbi:hypothetical protein LOTGIDRAFT_231658 [Lottia gigantea]|uniref:R3H domain-containing protein n=1 Tax=Lottia gigantea TaxID=225164 RepID=V4AIK2_LOTGI|nr:hypothetical protein LOTGIDRAFT_231658 [Lottia gigantea]ESO96822.1 hypothetical protein LOTGIDRAFT_231658 [Lottia gigantea]
MKGDNSSSPFDTVCQADNNDPKFLNDYQNSTTRVLIFPPFNSYHRLLVHKVIEVSPVLHSFSIGEGDQRRTVVCLHQALLSGEDRGELMSSPIPEFSDKSKGRGRGRNLERNSPSPVGRREESQSSSPGGTPRADSDVKVRSRPAGRGKARRPEIQRYVPRGRRQQGEDTNSQRQNDTSDKKSDSPKSRETRDKPVIGGYESPTNRRDETPESWDRLADDDLIEDKPAVELVSESNFSPASKKSKTDAESDHCIESANLQSENSVPRQTDDQSDVLPSALPTVLAHPQSSSIPQNSSASDDSATNATHIPLTSIEHDPQMPPQNSNEHSSVSSNVHLNSQLQEVNDDKANCQQMGSDNPCTDRNTIVAIDNESSDLNEVTTVIEDNKQSDTAMETSCDMDTSEKPNTESDITAVAESNLEDTTEITEVADPIPDATFEKDQPPMSTSPARAVATDMELSNTAIIDNADSVETKSESTTIESTIVHPAPEHESSLVLASDETSNISESCQDVNCPAETQKDSETDSSKKTKKKKDKSKKKGEKKSKTDNDDETVDKPKKKKSKADKTRQISKNDNDNDIKNLETGNEVKGQRVCNDEEGEEKMKTDNADNDDEDDWDKMFDDNGDCLEPTLIDELTSHVGQVAIDKPKVDYLAYQPKDADLSSSAYHHLIEIYDFPTEFVTSDLLMSFKAYMNKGFDIKWVDDTHAIGVFASAVAAQDAVKMIHPLFKVRPIEMASKQSKLKAKRTAEFLMPYKERPKTTAMAARRLVSGALGLTSKVSKEKSDQERSQLKEAKEKRKNERKLKQDIWDGSVSKCAMDNS